jgi:glycosyltransferase involved in cell wall biosynthesis
MKILFPYLARWRSANRSRYHQLLSHLCSFGHQVYILTAPEMAFNDISARDLKNCARETPADMILGELYTPSAFTSFCKRSVPGTRLLKKGLISLTSINQIHRFILKEKIDSLIVYNLPQAPLLYRAECRTHFDIADDLVAMMGVEHGLLASIGGAAVAKAVQRRMIARADTVTVASSILAERQHADVLMLPNGADLEELDRAAPTVWGGLRPGPTVGFVGAFEYWVDFDLVLRTAKRMPGVNFLLVGGGRRFHEVAQQVNYLRLDNVHLTGALPYREAMNYVAAMDVCLLPFTRDAVSDGSSPLKLFEYAAMRKPIVSTSTREAARIGRGWMSFADDEKDFVGAIDAFLADHSLSKRSGEAGRARIEQIYNWPRLARQFEDLLLSQAKPAPAVQPAVEARRTAIVKPSSATNPGV